MTAASDEPGTLRLAEARDLPALAGLIEASVPVEEPVPDEASLPVDASGVVLDVVPPELVLLHAAMPVMTDPASARVSRIRFSMVWVSSVDGGAGNGAP